MATGERKTTYRGKTPSGDPHPVDIHVGEKLRLARTLRGMSQSELGARLGLTFQQVQKYESGANRVSASRLFEMAEVLDVPISFFFDGAPKPSLTVRPGPGMPEDPASYRPFDVGREELELMRHYQGIGQEDLRRGVYDLVKLLSEALTDKENKG